MSEDGQKEYKTRDEKEIPLGKFYIKGNKQFAIPKEGVVTSQQQLTDERSANTLAELDFDTSIIPSSEIDNFNTLTTITTIQHKYDYELQKFDFPNQDVTF